MSVGSFLFGSSGGLTKNQQRILDKELAALNPDDLAGITAYAQRRTSPVFGQARARVAEQYANADAPITSGGRTQAEIGLAGEESNSIADIVEQERQQRRALRQYLLGIKLQPKAPTSGLIPSLAGGAGAFIGAGGLDLLKSKPQAKQSLYV